MFCHSCGQPLPAGARFCAHCGAAANPNIFVGMPGSTMYRPRAHRMFAGVCAALNVRFGWDLTATRILAVILGILLFPVTEVAYLVCWLLIPEEVPATAVTPVPAPIVTPPPAPAPHDDFQPR